MDLKDRELDQAREIGRAHRIGPGESEVLVVASQGSRVLLDEGRATRVAAALGFIPISTQYLPLLGLWCAAFELPEARRLLRRLSMVTGIRADDLVRLDALLVESSR